MSSYLYDANASDVIQPMSQNPQFHPKNYKLTPLLKIFIVLNEKGKEKDQWEGEIQPRIMIETTTQKINSTSMKLNPRTIKNKEREN